MSRNIFASGTPMKATPAYKVAHALKFHRGTDPSWAKSIVDERPNGVDRITALVGFHERRGIRWERWEFTGAELEERGEGGRRIAVQHEDFDRPVP